MHRLIIILALASSVFLIQAPVPVNAQAGLDQAEVIFHRPNKIKWKATRFNIAQDGRPIGQLLAGTEISVSLDPGTYTFTASATSLDGVDQITLTVQAGMTYRVKGEVMASWPVGRPKFTDVSESGVPTPQDASVPAQATSQPTPANSSAAVTGTEATRLGLRSFVGDWSMKSWSLTADGRRLEGAGTVTGSAVGDHAVRLTVAEFVASEMPNARGGGIIQISLHPQRGLSLKSSLPATDEELNLTGQVQSGKYVFYQIGGGGETMSGMQRSSFRLELRPIDEDSWVAETYSSVDGRTTQIQGASFTRR